ncbi:MAG: hypothetical protein Ct9H300mP1_02850 [Planctomycetaceae bacterium]|nr:MAG: hypothetical protein Ct9H300mP1_02850 [Planctomycetaceae bacterium]
MKFPREGEVVVRVRAHAVVPPGAGVPRMRIGMGVRADVRAPEKTLAEVDVANSEPRTFTFRGRIESFPLPGHNPKYPGLQVTVYNAYEDGRPKTRKKKKKKKKKAPVEPDPTQPLLVIESVDFEGPVFDAWPPATHTRIFFPTSGQPTERQYAGKILSRFMTRAYRRPVGEDELAGSLALYDKLRTARRRSRLPSVTCCPWCWSLPSFSTWSNLGMVPLLDSRWTTSNWPHGCRISSGARCPTTGCSNSLARAG